MTRVLLFLLSFFIAFSAFALNLQQAKDQGLVGEANTGLIAPITARPSQEVRSLVAEVNKRRTNTFKRISVSHGLTVKEVGHIAHKKAIEKTSSGNYYQDSSGQWIKK
ncbi:YdbL family protein [Photobacterium sp. DNB23_23_1]|uniref:YdbL family protein n=1 Tax=Photobacterium pectinilyticum TaxID=2906793 RepID=A0ABT1MWR7_9GAMM|nr:YdbL family protein [Photobacterium sp. ZSDE20]MCQ1056947.1 YdbL family protein [Photobacterium sp. ZSDE20]MDD1821082.1 YdbL family protein [Photobacterium sp. ZSDE20]